VVALTGGRNTRLFVSTDLPGFYALRDQTVTSYPMAVPRPVDCYSLDPIHHTAWMGTLGAGLIRWRNGTIVHVRVRDGLYDNRISGILKDDHGNFWMASSKGIFRVSESELNDFADGKSHFITSIPFSTGQLRFECQSGVQPAAYRTRDGRLWFSTTSGLVMVDPNDLISNKVPPSVRITATIVNGRRLPDLGKVKLMPWEEKNLEIHYAGLTFISPEKVTFRYILEGYNKEWMDAGNRREAFFTNLPPGQFHFRVLARNADGIWSKQAASLALTIEPRLYQRGWFFPLLALLAGLAVFLGYQLRIRQLNNRFALVLAERNRIARELHDTLLQGLSGITMQLQAVWTRLPASKERNFLEEIIKDAARCSQEARQSLWGLRASGPGSPDFSEHLATEARRALQGKPIALVLDLQPCSLRTHPGIEFQLLRIAQQAISNTLAHAQAETLSISLRRESNELCLILQDDGVGFALQAARPFGHYGLTGMQERANEIGATLVLTSKPEWGTKIEIRLPLSRSAEPNANAEVAVEHQYK
jgi:signal transduction histidine kinase